MDTIFYEINVRSFYDSNNDGIGDFNGLRLKLDYIVQLGIDCIWLLPFYPSPLRDGGYDITDSLLLLNVSATCTKNFHESFLSCLCSIIMNKLECFGICL
jgi:hypothetical protein